MGFDEKVLNYDEFKVDLAKLDEPRKPGISAILRIKNGAEFLRITIESHLSYFDEIVACYNDCSDSTVSILEELQNLYPDKVKIFEYKPFVHPIFSVGHNSVSTQDIHSFANFSNFAFSKASYSIVGKLDDDHLAIDRNLKSVVSRIRNDIASNVKKIYTFSGVNLAFDVNNKLGVYKREPLVGTGDHMYFPVSSKIYFSQEKNVEAFKFLDSKCEKKYMGVLYFHLKHLKSGYGFLNLEPQKRNEIVKQYVSNSDVVGFEDFISEDSINNLCKYHNPIEYWLRTQKIFNVIIYALFKRNPPLRIARLNQLFQDLNGIDLDECVTRRLKKF